MLTVEQAPPVSFGLTQEQELLRQELRRFGEERVRPGSAERDAQREFPAELVRELGEMGLLGCFVPERWGGAGFDQVSYAVAIEELARACPSIAVTISVSNSVCCWPILNFGSDELKERALRASSRRATRWGASASASPAAAATSPA